MSNLGDYGIVDQLTESDLEMVVELKNEKVNFTIEGRDSGSGYLYVQLHFENSQSLSKTTVLS